MTPCRGRSDENLKSTPLLTVGIPQLLSLLLTKMDTRLTPDHEQTMDNDEKNAKTTFVEGQSSIQFSSHSENVLDPLTYHIQAEETRQLLFTLDVHIAPVVMCLYLLAFLDRSNIGKLRTYIAYPSVPV